MKAGIILTMEFNEKWNEQYIDYIDDKTKKKLNNETKSEEKDNLEKLFTSKELEDKNKITINQMKVIKKIYGENIKINNQEIETLNFQQGNKIIKDNLKKKSYLDYISDENKNKNSKSFTLDNLYINRLEKENIQKEFIAAEKKGSLLWKGVISFDNEFLIENKIISKDKKYINDKQLKIYTQKSLKEFILHSNLAPNNVNVFCGLHYNTDNIHVHFALSEKEKTTNRGMIKEEVFKKSKSKMANEISRDITFYKKIESLNQNIKKEFDSIKYEKLFQEIKQEIPKEGRVQYNSKNLDEKTRIKLNILIKYNLDQNDNYKEFIKELKFKEERYKLIYGEKNKEYKKYSKNKIFKLYSEVGNKILKNAKNSEKTLEEENLNIKTPLLENKIKAKSKKQYSIPKKKLNSIVNKIKKEREEDYKRIQSELEYE